MEFTIPLIIFAKKEACDASVRRKASLVHNFVGNEATGLFQEQIDCAYYCKSEGLLIFKVGFRLGQKLQYKSQQKCLNITSSTLSYLSAQKPDFLKYVCCSAKSSMVLKVYVVGIVMTCTVWFFKKNQIWFSFEKVMDDLRFATFDASHARLFCKE